MDPQTQEIHLELTPEKQIRGRRRGSSRVRGKVREVLGFFSLHASFSPAKHVRIATREVQLSIASLFRSQSRKARVSLAGSANERER